MQRTNIYLTDEQRTALAARATTEGTTVAALVRGLIDRGLAYDEDDLAGELAAFEESFGALRGIDMDVVRGDGERGAHLERIAQR